ncbi:2,3-bisphosphoglycerate-dependent phosphoglycerate mutase isoform X1 [Drosophila nasuta]|uniref:2,3-bisphosphoglycerate-dependent phosphoglycerate mutase isoform X1 n=1 Tax=Drosophila nasuta TaxID=42062 RepID=UPI001471FF96|nr:2,3-bisphosphoglycerate-dependent phosphoglycerate mutase isoform X1 [Drosophila nasuta]
MWIHLYLSDTVVVSHSISKNINISNFFVKSNRLVLVRHGESEFNLKNLFCGWHDTPLSEGGLQQSRTIAAAKLLEAKIGFDKVYCSALGRSRQSADVILAEMKSSYLPVVLDWRLNERHYGNLTGSNKRQVADAYGEQQVQAWRRGYDEIPPPIEPSNSYYYAILNNLAFRNIPVGQFPLSESMHMCVDRVKPIWEEIKKEVLQGKRVLIVAHGTVARALVQHIEDLSNEDIVKVNVPNCVPIVYEFDLRTGDLIGNSTYLGDAQYIENMKDKVAAIGD